MPHNYEEHSINSRRCSGSSIASQNTKKIILSSMVNIPYTWHLTHNTYSDNLYGAIICILMRIVQVMICVYTLS